MMRYRFWFSLFLISSLAYVFIVAGTGSIIDTKRIFLTNNNSNGATRGDETISTISRNSRSVNGTTFNSLGECCDDFARNFNQYLGNSSYIVPQESVIDFCVYAMNDARIEAHALVSIFVIFSRIVLLLELDFT